MTKYIKIAPDPDTKPCRCGEGNPDCDHFDFCPECGEEYKEHEGHDCIDGVPVQDLRALAKELRDSLDEMPWSARQFREKAMEAHDLQAPGQRGEG